MASDPVTVGVAVAVPEPYATDLRAHRASFGDPAADTVPTHVTLLPPTLLECGDMADVQSHLEVVARRHRAFPMRLRGTGTFRPVSPVVFVTVARGISECELLSESVCSGPLDRELAFPYHPHVTVAHDVSDQRARPGLRHPRRLRLRLRRGRLHAVRARGRSGMETGQSLPVAPGLTG